MDQLFNQKFQHKINKHGPSLAVMENDRNRDGTHLQPKQTLKFLSEIGLTYSRLLKLEHLKRV